MILLSIIIQAISFIVFLFVQPYHDTAIINTETSFITSVTVLPANQIVSMNNRAWHISAALQFALFNSFAPITLIIVNLKYLIPAIIIYVLVCIMRLTFFPIALNMRRGVEAFHMGTAGLDLWLTKVLGSSAGLIKTIIGMVSYIIFNCVLIKLYNFTL